MEVAGRFGGRSDIIAFSYNPILKKKTTLPYPLVINAQGRTQYFEVKIPDKRFLKEFHRSKKNLLY